MEDLCDKCVEKDEIPLLILSKKCEYEYLIRNITFGFTSWYICHLSPSEAIHQRNKVYCIAVITV